MAAHAGGSVEVDGAAIAVDVIQSRNKESNQASAFAALAGCKRFIAGGLPKVPS